MRNRFRTYNSHSYVPRSEVHQHVMTAYRPDADPIWHEVASIAAKNGCDPLNSTSWQASQCGGEGVTFLYPTMCKRGYFYVLKWISENDNVKSMHIKAHFGKMPITTLARLKAGMLIHHDKSTHRYTITELGKVYLRGAIRHLKERKMR